MSRLVESVKRRILELPSGKRKTLMLTGVGVGLVVVLMVYYYTQGGGSGKARKEPVATSKNYQFPKTDIAKQVWTEHGQRQLNLHETEIKNLRQTVANLESILSELKKNGGEAGQGAPAGGYAPGSAQEREAKLSDDLKKMGVVPVEKSGDIYPPSPVPPAVAGKVVSAEPEPDGVAKAPAEAAPQVRYTATQPVQPRIMGIYNFAKQSAPNADLETSKAMGGGEAENAKYADTENFYTPGGSFFKVYILTGLEAPAGPTSSGKPLPALLRIQDLSWLPNEVRQNVTGCFVMGESYGDLATERAYIRGINISCVNKDNKTVLDEELMGYVADTDGKLGLRGRVVSKQGQFLARGIWASFIEGVAKGFDNSTNTTVVTSGYGTGTSSTTNDIDNFGDGFRRGMSSGLSKTASKLSEFYMKSAEQLYPVIEINAKRNATFVISEGKRFSFNKLIMIEQKKKGDAHAEL